MRVIRTVTFVASILAATVSFSQEAPGLPSGPLVFGGFEGEFRADGSFRIEGEGLPPFFGTWAVSGGELVLDSSECTAPGRYRFELETRRLHLQLITDDCGPRGMVLGGSTWRPAADVDPIPERRLALTVAAPPPPIPEPGSDAGSWPSFRGPAASGVAKEQHLPDAWDGETGKNILWKRPIPGLGHSSPIVWGERVFVTSAVSSRPDASFRPGLYGDGDASDDHSTQRWMIYALDRRTGDVVWERVAYEGEPLDKRHVKSTYASATPATDGRLVVAWFGSQGVYTYTVAGDFLWSLDLGRLDLGAYDIPTFEWGPASSPILWNGLVFLQCDTQKDSFVVALDAESGETIWKTERDELPSWGTPSVYEGRSGSELITNASNYIRGYDTRNGKELWRLGRSSKITAPTPVFGDELIVVVSGRRPEQPLFVVRAGARGDLTLSEGQTESDAIAWSRERRGSYMPTPLIYQGILYVLANNGIFDAYDLASGEDIYRRRIPHLGSGFSASPVAADGKIYLSNEDGDMIVVRAGRSFELVGTNSMGELLMATPALSQGVMYVKALRNLFAVGPSDEPLSQERR